MLSKAITRAIQMVRNVLNKNFHITSQHTIQTEPIWNLTKKKNWRSCSLVWLWLSTTRFWQILLTMKLNSSSSTSISLLLLSSKLSTSSVTKSQNNTFLRTSKFSTCANKFTFSGFKFASPRHLFLNFKNIGFTVYKNFPISSIRNFIQFSISLPTETLNFTTNT